MKTPPRRPTYTTDERDLFLGVVLGCVLASVGWLLYLATHGIFLPL